MKPCPICKRYVKRHREGWFHDHTTTGSLADPLCAGSGQHPNEIDLSEKEKHVSNIDEAISMLRTAVAASAPRDRFAIGTVIRWTASERYTYAAIKTNVGWFTTARPSNPFIKNMLTYEELEEILARPETTDAAVATAWEFLDGQGEREITVQEESHEAWPGVRPVGPRFRDLPGGGYPEGDPSADAGSAPGWNREMI